jgi:hypothetical protein
MLAVFKTHSELTPQKQVAFSSAFNLVSAFTPLKFTLIYRGVFPVLVLFFAAQGKKIIDALIVLRFW